MNQCRRIGQRFAFYCDPMRESLTHSTDNGKGLAEMQGWPVDEQGQSEGERRLLGVVYRIRAGHHGFMLNVCPWCKASLEWSEPAPSSSAPPPEKSP
jgi:hypothetical protein